MLIDTKSPRIFLYYFQILEEIIIGIKIKNHGHMIKNMLTLEKVIRIKKKILLILMNIENNL